MKNFPYLDRPLLPLSVALPRMLAEEDDPQRLSTTCF
jgi:hypothetical protein